MLRCMICDNAIRYRVLTPCDHSDLCLQCYLRAVICYNNHSCVVCTKEYSSYPIATTNLSPGITYKSAESKSKLLQLNEFHLLYSDAAVLNEIMNYMSFRCSFCKTKFSVFTNPNQLTTTATNLPQNLNNRINNAQNEFSNHLKNIHHQCACFICLNSHRFLPCEAISYSQRDFKLHKSEMHKKCPCCPFVGFDAHELEIHMNDIHVRCDICLQLYNKVLWFKNETELLDHYKKDHYICYHPECIDSLIAFPTQLELLQHLTRVHHEKVDMNGVSLVPTETNEKLAQIRQEEENEKRSRIILSNKKFVNKLKEVFQNDETKIQNLRSNAILLINNRINVQDFYKKFCEICGDEKRKVFTDMVAIMPDPGKRAELLRLSENIELSPDNQNKKNFPKSVSMPSVSRNMNDDNDNYNNDNNPEVQPTTTHDTAAPFFELQRNRQNPPPPPPPNNQQSKKKKKGKKMIISDF